MNGSPAFSSEFFPQGISIAGLRLSGKNPVGAGLAPQCPQEGTVRGTITAANVIAGSTASQQLKAGDLAAVITAIRAGMAYANVHTTPSPGGEIRGQIRIIAK